ncbi:hypothetical protein [Alteribacillus sp. HJP-4]|uniref:hypothetical protein n=1 Tax=Alteribacillus sp. HJP-4 TaxID=2775394 RepID=UPI0035CD0690
MVLVWRCGGKGYGSVEIAQERGKSLADPGKDHRERWKRCKRSVKRSPYPRKAS